VNYDNSLVVTITVTLCLWAPSSGDHLFTYAAIYRPPQFPSFPAEAGCESCVWIVLLLVFIG